MGFIDEINDIVNNTDLQVVTNEFVKCEFERIVNKLYDEIKSDIMEKAKSSNYVNQAGKKLIMGTILLSDKFSSITGDQTPKKIFPNRDILLKNYPLISCSESEGGFYHLEIHGISGQKELKTSKPLFSKYEVTTIYAFVDVNGERIINLLKEKAKRDGIVIDYDLRTYVNDSSIGENFIPNKSEYTYKSYNHKEYCHVSLRIKYSISVK